MSFYRRRRVKIRDYFNYEEFKNWVYSKNDDEIIGRTRKGNNPVVRFIQEVRGLEDVRVVGEDVKRIKFVENGRRVISYYDGIGYIRHNKLMDKDNLTAGEFKKVLK
jgi:hypothetical protein